MAKTITIQPGDTLEDIARKHLGDASLADSLGRQLGVTNDLQMGNTTLAPGTEITIPEAGSLKGTMGSIQDTKQREDNKPADASTPDLSDINLPSPGEGEDVDTTASKGNLANFKNILRSAANKAVKQARKQGLKTAQETLEVQPEEVSGQTFSGIANFITQQTGGGAEQIFTSTVDLLEKQRSKAQDQLNTIITQDALNQFSEDKVRQLAKQAGRDPDLIVGLRNQQQADSQEDLSSESMIKKGKKAFDPSRDDTANRLLLRSKFPNMSEATIDDIIKTQREEAGLKPLIISRAKEVGDKFQSRDAAVKRIKSDLIRGVESINKAKDLPSSVNRAIKDAVILATQNRKEKGGLVGGLVGDLIGVGKESRIKEAEERLGVDREEFLDEEDNTKTDTKTDTQTETSTTTTDTQTETSTTTQAQGNLDELRSKVQKFINANPDASTSTLAKGLSQKSNLNEDQALTVIETFK